MAPRPKVSTKESLLKDKKILENGLKVAQGETEIESMKAALEVIESELKALETSKPTTIKVNPKSKHQRANQTRGNAGRFDKIKGNKTAKSKVEPEPKSEKPTPVKVDELEECQRYYMEKAERKAQREANPPKKKQAVEKLENDVKHIYNTIVNHDKFSCEDKTDFRKYMNKFFEGLSEYLPLKSLQNPEILPDDKVKVEAV